MSIFPKSEYKKIFTGSQITAQFVQATLEEAQLQFIARNDGESGRIVGLATSYMNEIVIFVKNEDFLRAKQIVDKALEDIQY